MMKAADEYSNKVHHLESLNHKEIDAVNERHQRQLKVADVRVYFSVQLITICAVVNLKCAPEKATCAVVICAVVKYLPK